MSTLHRVLVVKGTISYDNGWKGYGVIRNHLNVTHCEVYQVEDSWHRVTDVIVNDAVWLSSIEL